MFSRVMISFCVGALLGAVVVGFMLIGDKGPMFEPHQIGRGIFTVYRREVTTSVDSQGARRQEATVRQGPGMITLPLAAGMAVLALTTALQLVRRPGPPGN